MGEGRELELPEEVRRTVQSLPLGLRIRRIRDHKKLTQGEVLGRFPEGGPKTAAWLSSVEAGKINPRQEQLDWLADALELSGADRDLLDPASLADDLIRYGAWQSVRLLLADRYASQLRGADARRARDSQELLAGYIRQHPGLGALRGAGWPIGDLKAYVAKAAQQRLTAGAETALSPQVRWALLIEGVFMQPYDPLPPDCWEQSRGAVLEALTVELQLRRPDDPAEERQVWEMLERSRRELGGLKTSARYLKNFEPKRPELSTGLPAVAAALLDDPSLDFVAGNSLVGEYGWPFAAGLYLAAPDQLVAALPAPWTPAAERRGGAAGASGFAPDVAVARLIWAVGQHALRNDLAKLWALGKIGAGRQWSLAESGTYSVSRSVLQQKLQTLYDRIDFALASLPELDPDLKKRQQAIRWYARK